MTAALEPVGICVGHLPNIRIGLSPQVAGVALSVAETAASQPTSWPDCAQVGAQGCDARIGIARQFNGDVVDSAMAPNFLSDVVGSPPLKPKLDDVTPCGENKDRIDEFKINPLTCTGPATPEQVDTVTSQSKVDCEKPQSRQELNIAVIPDREYGLISDASGDCGEREPINACSGAPAQDSPDKLPVTSMAADHISPCPSAVVICADVVVEDGIGLATGTATTSMAHTDTAASVAASGSECTTADAPVQATVSERAVAAALPVDPIREEAEPKTPTTPQRQRSDAPLLPPSTDLQRMTLVLDLDGTLIASEDEPHAPVPFDYCVDEERFVWLRPGLRRFLDSVRPQFEVVLFTAAGESWATSALQRIDPDGTIFDTRLYRDHTVSHDDWPWVKDLSRLGRDLARVVIVDDNPLMFMYQPDNALHVAAYDPQLTGSSDDVLEQVLDVLIHKVLIADDVREVLRTMKEPITASCMAARLAAAKAEASPSQGASLRKAMATAQAAIRKAMMVSPRAAGVAATPSPVRGATEAAADPGPSLTSAAAAGDQAKVGRRGRRSVKQQQQPQAAGGAAQQGTAAAAQQQLQAGSVGASAQQQQQQCEGKQRQPRSRRRGPGGNAGADAAGDALWANAARAHAAAVPAAAPTLAAAASRPPAVATRGRGQKQAKKRGAVQLAAASPLQEPDQQLQLKLKLLQLQREQEAAEVSQGDDEDTVEPGAVLREPGREGGVRERVAVVAESLREASQGGDGASESCGASLRPGPHLLGQLAALGGAATSVPPPAATGKATVSSGEAKLKALTPRAPTVAKACSVESTASTPQAAAALAASSPCAATAPASAVTGPAGTSSCATARHVAPPTVAGAPHAAATPAAADTSAGADAEGARELAGGNRRRARGRRRRRRRLVDTPGGSIDGGDVSSLPLPAEE